MARTRIRAGDAEIIREAKARFERCVTWETATRDRALSDARFAAGDSINKWQWDRTAQTMRGDRPMLTLNKTRQHILHIVNDARNNKTRIKITPVGGHASYEAAQIFQGIIRRIEYQSKAVDAYSTAIFHQVETGIGYCRVVTDYADEESFDQDLFIRRIPNPRTVYLDPDAREYDKADMNFAFVFTDHARDVWEAEHGKQPETSTSAAFDHSEGWDDKDHIREAEYWRRTTATDTLHLMVDGSTLRESTLEDGELEAMQPYIVKSRDVSEPEIEWFKIVGSRITERKEWLGKYIPIVPFIGEETVIENEMDRKGHTRALIDAQCMYNYWNSAAAEQVALQGKSPFIADARATEGREQQWESANTTNWAVLYYNGIDDTGQPIQKPERQQPPQMAQAYIEGMQIARQDLMEVSGQYQAEMGAPGNERSGVAIDRRQRQGETATAHYLDNSAKAIRQIGRILLDMIPKVYDTARVIKIMAEDGSDSDVHLVPNAPQPHQHVAMGPDGTPQKLTPQQADEQTADPDVPNPKIIFNPQIGRYDCESDVGPDFATRRQEAFNAFSQIMAQNKEAFTIVGDFWAANADFPGADELAERLKKGLPAAYKGGPDPAALEMQQHAHDLLGRADQEIADLKQKLQAAEMAAKDKGASNQIAEYDSETKRLAALGQVDPMLVQMIARQLWENMQNTSIVEPLRSHAAIEQSLQPPEPVASNGAGAPVQ